jgi:hypothetical protein
VGEDVTLYTPSLMVPDIRTGRRDDLTFVVLWLLLLTAIRSLVFRVVLLPVARCFKVQDGMDQHKFCEYGWQCMWYTLAFVTGARIQWLSSYWFGVCGGPADWREALWAEYPQALHTSDMKCYYLIQVRLVNAFLRNTLRCSVANPAQNSVRVLENSAYTSCCESTCETSYDIAYSRDIDTDNREYADLSSVCTVGLLAAHDCRYIGRGKTKQTTEIYHNCNYMWSDNALYTYRADTHTQC